MTDLLFVYGTLQKNRQGETHPLLKGQAKFLYQASVPGLLYEVDHYPAAISNPTHNKNLIHGELYRLYQPELVLPQLDEFEECTNQFPQPWEYQRSQILITTSAKLAIWAWVYLYNWSVQELQVIPSGNYKKYCNTQCRLS
ncbi:gamma-glutamylcyclotransferase family protein [Methylomonas sp. AM2-LC]|uniref:gamma-glutamylcyclotransferase family protein n=1 Tax=Methylomonas sp. AM2-LC TaxID=3153301 RepID=UPI003265285F